MRCLIAEQLTQTRSARTRAYGLEIGIPALGFAEDF
jgi:hypothetical protein